MMALIVGTLTGLFIIGSVKLMKNIEEQLIFGLILSAIGFLYVGFTWKDLPLFGICCFQAVIFLFMAYYGTKKSMLLLAVGYCLHGCWDFAFDQIFSTQLIPPHYDLFCLSVDFAIGVYLFVLSYRNEKSCS